MLSINFRLWITLCNDISYNESVRIISRLQKLRQKYLQTLCSQVQEYRKGRVYLESLLLVSKTLAYQLHVTMSCHNGVYILATSLWFCLNWVELIIKVLSPYDWFCVDNGVLHSKAFHLNIIMLSSFFYRQLAYHPRLKIQSAFSLFSYWHLSQIKLVFDSREQFQCLNISWY